jgi:hypothetical protein
VINDSDKEEDGLDEGDQYDVAVNELNEAFMDKDSL